MTVNLAKQAATEIRPNDFLCYRIYLKALYSKAKNNKKSYSVRKFSDELGFGVSTLLHQIMKGYRPLSERNGQKIAEALELNDYNTQYLLQLIGYVNASETHVKDRHFAKLVELKSKILPEQADKDLMHYFSEWHHPVIREMVTMADFDNNPEWITGKLVAKITAQQATESMDLLQRLGFISLDEETGKYKQTDSRLATSNRVRGMALLKYHQQMIDFGRLALTTIKGRRRNINTVTVCCNDDTVKKINTIINLMQTQILDLVDNQGSGDQIYQVNVQMFPFTNEPEE